VSFNRRSSAATVRWLAGDTLLKKLITTLDQLPERILLVANSVFGVFVILAHGGALALTYVHPDDNAESIRQLASISLPLAVLVLASSIYAFTFERHRAVILKIHAIILLCANLALIFWGISLLLGEFPRGNFGWTPGMMTGMFAYSIYLCRRTWLAQSIGSSALVRYLHVLAIIVVLPIDLSIFARFAYLLLREHFFR